MPELPEVEHARRLVAEIALGRRIVHAECADDPLVFDGLTPGQARAFLEGSRITAVHRRGKYFWCELDRRPWPVFHLGMTGHVRAPGVDGLRLSSDAREPDTTWPPRYGKIRLVLDDDGEWAMTSARRWARIRFQKNPLDEQPIAGLGFDPLTDLPSAGEFTRLLLRRRAVMKSLLLNQHFIAGVGNWIADELLYQSRINPLRRASSLSRPEAKRVYIALRTVVQKACAVNADKQRFPRTWLYHRRWGRRADAQTVRGEEIRFDTIAGRTTAWCPQRQV